MTKEQYHDKNKRFKKGNPGGGRPKKLSLKEFEPEAQEIYERLVLEFCELLEIDTLEEGACLPESIKGLLEGARVARLHILSIEAKKTIDSSDQKMLNKFLGRYENCISRAYDTVKKQFAIKQAKGKGGKKPTGFH